VQAQVIRSRLVIKLPQIYNSLQDSSRKISFSRIYSQSRRKFSRQKPIRRQICKYKNGKRRFCPIPIRFPRCQQDFVRFNLAPFVAILLKLNILHGFMLF